MKGFKLLNTKPTDAFTMDCPFPNNIGVIYQTYTTQKLQTHNLGESQKTFIPLISWFENPIILQILVQTSAKRFRHSLKVSLLASKTITC